MSMEIPFRLIDFLSAEVLAAAERAGGFDPDFAPEVRTADPRFGHYQANGVLPFAKKRRVNPRALAEGLVAALDGDRLGSMGIGVSIAGPGFINFTLSGRSLLSWLRGFRDEAELEARLVVDGLQGVSTVVDFSSPNTAKQMHVGHIRSTVIGDVIARLLAVAGATVTRDNHIGDWGTQFGILILALKETGTSLDDLGEDPLAGLERLYREGTRLCEEDPAKKEQARAELVALQGGDPEAVAAWEKINAVSLASFGSIYAQLGVSFDLVHGESFYQDRVGQVCDELFAHGIAEESDGALVVFHPEHPRFASQPFMIRKSDGASNYATTDLATLLYRAEVLGARRIIYVTDARQQDHFEQLFLTARRWFAATGRELPELEHVWFGKMLGEDGKAIKTRSGESIKLRDLMAEGVRRAEAIIAEKNPDLDLDERATIAATIGVDAIRYADLMQNRTIDYVFSWDKLVGFEGNTAPYLLYAVARIHGIFRRIGVERTAIDGAAASDPETDEELALAARLAEFPVAFGQALADLRPHFLCTYLYDVTVAFGSFYNANRVNVEADDVRARRLLLCARTLDILRTGLRILGIRPLEKM